jgi:hypothetical protein
MFSNINEKYLFFYMFDFSEVKDILVLKNISHTSYTICNDYFNINSILLNFNGTAKYLTDPIFKFYFDLKYKFISLTIDYCLYCKIDIIKNKISNIVLDDFPIEISRSRYIENVSKLKDVTKLKLYYDSMNCSYYFRNLDFIYNYKLYTLNIQDLIITNYITSRDSIYINLDDFKLLKSINFLNVTYDISDGHNIRDVILEDCYIDLSLFKKCRFIKLIKCHIHGKDKYICSVTLNKFNISKI